MAKLVIRNTHMVSVSNEKTIDRNGIIHELKNWFAPIEILFTKKDGSERLIKATLFCETEMVKKSLNTRPGENCVPKEYAGMDHNTNKNIIRVWDTEKRNWRTMRSENITAVYM